MPILVTLNFKGNYAYHLSSVYILCPGFSDVNHLRGQDYQKQFAQTVLQTQDQSEEEKSANCEFGCCTVCKQHTNWGQSNLKEWLTLSIVT